MNWHSYHCIDIHPHIAPAAGTEWLEQRLRDTRARLLQQLGVTSGALRGHGLRLRVERPACDELPATGRIGIAIRLLDVGDDLRLAESLYQVEHGWRPLWHSIARVGVYDGGGRAALPHAMAARARCWARLIRGEIPGTLDRLLAARQP